MSDERPLDYAAPGVDIDAVGRGRSAASARVVESTFTAGARGAFGGFGGMFRIPADVPAPGARLERRRRRHEAHGRHRGEPARHRRPRSREPLRRTTSSCRARVPLFFLDYVAFGGSSPRSSKRSWRASPRAAARTAARSSAARRRRCRASTRRPTTISPASSSAAWKRTPSSAPTASRRATSSSASRAAGCTPTATRSRGASSPSG